MRMEGQRGLLGPPSRSPQFSDLLKSYQASTHFVYEKNSGLSQSH